MNELRIKNESNNTIEWQFKQSESEVKAIRFNTENKKIETEWIFTKISLDEICRTMKSGDHIAHNEADNTFSAESDEFETDYLNVRCDRVKSRSLFEKFLSSKK